MSQDKTILNLSRKSSALISSQAGNSKGTGFFVDDQHVLTCFHVIATLSQQGQNVNWQIHPDLQVTLPSGESIGASVISIPTQSEPGPLVFDFALLKLARTPSTDFARVEIASDQEQLSVGDEVTFSGYPLATPGMVTHRGMVSGFDASSSLIFVQASINKGNSGGALLNSRGHVVGIVSMREGGISRGLNELTLHIDNTAHQGSVRIMGVDPLQSTKAIIQTLDQYISTGIGYSRSIKFVREYFEKNPALLK
jgi:S1-C subfamily serine protease